MILSNLAGPDTRGGSAGQSPAFRDAPSRGVPPDLEKSDVSYLDEVRTEGSLDSSGTFTLDAAALPTKLGKHQLPSPHYYVLKLVQSAVAGGASMIRFRRSLGGDLEVVFDGKLWTQMELDQLSHYALGAAPHQRHLMHLSVAVQAILALNPTHWELGSPRGNLHGESEVAANTVRLSWGSGVGKIVAWLGMRIFWNGARLLSNRAKYGPIPVFLGDSAVNRHVGVVNLPYWWTQNELPLVLPPDADATDICYCLPEEGGGDIMGSSMTICTGVSWWQGTQPVPEMVRETTAPFRSYRMVIAPEHELPGIIYGERNALGCSAIIQRCPISAGTGSLLTPIWDGVALDREKLHDFPAGYKFWVSARHLGTDLSHFKVLKDERYEELVKTLGHLVNTAWH